MSVKLSVIISVYNAEKYIGQCLDSILSSSLGNGQKTAQNRWTICANAWNITGPILCNSLADLVYYEAGVGSLEGRKYNQPA